MGLPATGGCAVLINEVQPANHATMRLPDGSSPDWVELVNTGTRPVDLLGMRLVLGARQHVIDAPLVIAAGEHRLLYCSGDPWVGVDHLVLKLPRAGGTLLLLDANGHDVLDIFTWPALPSDVSMGRYPDGGAGWSFFPRPTPGSPNQADQALRAIAPAPVPTILPGMYTTPIELDLAVPPGGRVHFTVDGSPPEAHSPVWTGPMVVRERIALRARTWQEGCLPGPEMGGIYVVGAEAVPMASIIMDPLHLAGDSGIYHPGAHANHTRTGVEWERPAMVGLPGAAHLFPVGVRIHGSGSRGLAKRSFKLHARTRYGSPTEGIPHAGGAVFTEAILRADASPHAFMRNVVLEQLVRAHGLQVDVQPSAPIALYLNERFWGMYRLMPPKNAQWLRSLSGAEALDVLAGPSLHAVNGSDGHFRKALAALYGAAPIDSIEALIDLASLIDLACLDLWTGRADHDLNVRLYRPRQAGGRWRWILYDMDVWAPANDNSLARMVGTMAPEAPWLGPLLAHPALAERLLARITALHAAVLNPMVAGVLVDTLYGRYEELLRADHRRWDLELDMAPPAASRDELRAFITTRPAHLMRQLAEHTGRSLHSVRVEVPPPGAGTLRLEGLTMTSGEHTVHGLAGVPVQLEAVAPPGMEFAGWKGVVGDGPVIRVDLARAKVVRPLFRPVVP